jgi:formate hydrogenlyase subunit 3/multisubunit Na+/H+ antiporter MnhD subunit
MSSSVIWIFLPGLFGLGLLFYRPADRFPLMAASIVSLFLAWIAWQFPIDVVLGFGPISFEIFPSLSFFGRSLTIGEFDRPLISVIYLFETLWIAGSVIAKPGRLFIPISLISVSLFVAALSVDPFLYAAIIIALAVLIFIPLLFPVGNSVGPGGLRFLIFEGFAVPFVLFTGWILTGVEASPGNLNLILRSGLLLLLGFTFLLALFPFHSWIPMLAKETHPYPLGFVLSFLPTVACVFALSFFDRYAWLRDTNFIDEILVLIGSLSILLSGLWALTERHLGRLMGYAVMMGIGFSLFAIGISGSQGVQLFFALLLPQLLAFWVLATSLGSIWNKQVEFNLAVLENAMKSSPLAMLGFFLSIFSLAGLPFLASFPPRFALFSVLSERAVWAAVLALVGCFFLAIAGARHLIAAVKSIRWARPTWTEEAQPLEKQTTDGSNPYMWAFLCIAVIGLIGFGLFSRLLLAGVPSLAAMFPQLFP